MRAMVFYQHGGPEVLQYREDIPVPEPRPDEVLVHVHYAALNRLMLEARKPAVREEILDTWEWHRDNLPLWADSACSVHAYEGKPDDEPEPSEYTKT